MRILITGGAGFLGSRLAEELTSNKQKVALLVRKQDDLWRVKDFKKRLKIFYSENDMERAFKMFKPKAVIHLATDFGRISHSRIKMIETNILFSARIMELCIKYKCRVVINSSTSLPSNYNYYAASKNAFLELGKYYSSNHNIIFNNVVLEYMYGAKDDAEKFIPYAIKQVIKGSVIKATSGFQKRDFIYVNDAAHILTELALTSQYTRQGSYRSYNISSGKKRTLRNILSEIEGIVGMKSKVLWGNIPYRKQEFNIKKIVYKEKIIRPKTKIVEGLKKTIQWFKDNK